jgi:replicative DNA helicase
LACQILAYAAGTGHPGALYEFEMGAAQVVRRLVSSESKITTYKMQSGYMADEDWPRLTDAIEKLTDYPIYLTSESMDTVELRADLHRAKDLYGVEVVVIDYEALLLDDDGKDDTEIGNNKSSRVHQIAKDLNLAMIVIDDMTKEGIKGQVKGKAGLAGGARKLHNADEIVLITQSEDKDKPNLFLATWDKNREGAKGLCAPLVRAPEFPFYTDYVSDLPRGRK